MNHLRNFDLTVEEIKLIKSINQIKDNLAYIRSKDPASTRMQYLTQELDKLQEELDELRENTLIR